MKTVAASKQAPAGIGVVFNPFAMSCLARDLLERFPQPMRRVELDAWLAEYPKGASPAFKADAQRILRAALNVEQRARRSR